MGMTANPDSLTADALSHYRKNGWVRIQRVISEMDADDLRERAAAHLDAIHRGAASAPKLAEGRTSYENVQCIDRHDSVIREFAMSSGFANIASELSGCDLRLFHADLLIKQPHSEVGGATPWHQDHPYSPVDRRGGLNLWIALDNIAPEMGPMRFLNGSQRCRSLGHGFDTENDLLVQMPWLSEAFEVSESCRMAKGDMSAHDSLTVHSAVPNTGNHPRWVLLIVYIPADARYTGLPSKITDGLALQVGAEFDHEYFPRVGR